MGIEKGCKIMLFLAIDDWAKMPKPNLMLMIDESRRTSEELRASVSYAK